MNQLESSKNRNSSAGRSRARGSDTGRSTAGRSSSGSRSTRGSSSTNRSRSTSSYRSGQSGRRNSPRRRKNGPDYKVIAIVGVVLIIVIACIAMAVKAKKAAGISETGTETAVQESETEMQKEVAVDGITITGMSKSQARAAILKEFPWSMTVSYKDDSYKVKDLMAEKVDALLNDIYNGEPDESYTLDTTGLEDAAAAEAAACAAKWDKKAVNGSIDKYDAASGKFVFAGESEGFAIDQDKLKADILQALKDKKYDAAIEASGSAVAPEISAASAKEKYKTIVTFTTNTTANKDRNVNVRLAAEAINGTVVKPGQEFSFNGTVGQRTEAKGYKAAGAYNNGEVVQEIGGGVCQVSTTLYNAVYRAGLQISYRRSHTFEPSYVTPGQDATVSYDQPDFKFINSTKAAVGIKASYADQKMTISLYGIPLLEDGVKWDLVSEKVEDTGVPAPTYEEDQTLQPGQEVQKSKGSSGSRWVTYKVAYKDGKEISRDIDHKTTYKGHNPVIRRNTTGVVLNPAETTTAATAATVDGMPDTYVPQTGESISPVETSSSATQAPSAGGSSNGPGMATTPAATTAPAAATTAAAPSAQQPAQSQPAATPAASAGDNQNPAGAIVVPVKPE